MLGDVVRLSRQRRRRAPEVPVIRATADDLEQVQKAWKAEDEERAMLFPRFVRKVCTSPAAESIKGVFDRVLFKHHPDGFPGAVDYDWPEEPRLVEP